MVVVFLQLGTHACKLRQESGMGLLCTQRGPGLVYGPRVVFHDHGGGLGILAFAAFSLSNLVV